MAVVHPREAEPLLLAGEAFLRGRGQALHPGGDHGRVREATLGRVETARADGLIDSAAEAYLAAQRAFHAALDPAGLRELEGIAEGFNLPFDELFAHLHLGTLRDLKAGATLQGDGCSAWAVQDGPDGPLVVKNRDYSGTHLGIQHVALHSGPDIRTGAWLAVGSLGSPGAYSSGMNARGLGLVDTQVSVRTHRVGWLRYFLMSRLLSDCASVGEALDVIAKARHAGGGTLVLCDAAGTVAAVELGADATTVITGPVIWRTNHFATPELADETLPPGDDHIAQNSLDRFAYLARRLPGSDWSVADAAELMKAHREAGGEAAPLCQHAEGEASQTLSTAVYSCTLGLLTFSEGNPCGGRWLEYRLPR